MLPRCFADRVGLLLSVVSLCGGILAYCGCDKPKTVRPGAATSANPARASWQPTPLELPKPVVVQWGDDDEQHASPGAIWQGNQASIGLIRFNLSGDTALVALASGVFHLVDPQTGSSRGHWDTLNKARLIAMEPTLDDRRVVLQYEGDPHLYVRELTDGKLLQTVGPPKTQISAFAVATDSRLLAVGDTTGVLQIWNLENGKILDEGTLPGPDDSVTTIAFSNDCRELYVAQAESPKISVFELPGLDHATFVNSVSR